MEVVALVRDIAIIIGVCVIVFMAINSWLDSR